jgi:hypothetical protein
MAVKAGGWIGVKSENGAGWGRQEPFGSIFFEPSVGCACVTGSGGPGGLFGIGNGVAQDRR